MLRVYDLSNNRCLHVLRGHSNAVTGVHIDGKEIRSCSHDFTIKFWNTDFYGCTQTLRQHKRSITAFASDGVCVITGDNAGAVKLWEPNIWR